MPATNVRACGEYQEYVNDRDSSFRVNEYANALLMRKLEGNLNYVHDYGEYHGCACARESASCADAYANAFLTLKEQLLQPSMEMICKILFQADY